MSEFGKYTSRPITVEAFKWDGASTTDEPQWFQDAVSGEGQEGLPQAEILPSGGVDIATMEGTMRANVGDWIIRGTEGEIYPCKDSVFRRKYELTDGGFERRASQLGGSDA